MRDRFFKFATDHPRIVFLALAIAVFGIGTQIMRAKVDTDPENMLPAEQAERIFHDKTREAFALHNMLVVGVVNKKDPDGVFNPASLARVHELSQKIKQIDGVIARDLMSPATVDKVTPGAEGSVRFDWLLPEPPETREQARQIKADALRLPMLKGTLVTENGQALAIYVPIEHKDQSHRISQEIKHIVAGFSGADQYYITGLPVAEDTFGHDMFVQMAISAPLAALVIFAIMWWFFRSVPLITAPMIIALSTVALTMGALIGMGFTVHIMSSMIPIFLMPIAVVNSVHILSEFSDEYRAGSDKRKVIQGVIKKLFTPMLYTSLTTIAGFGSLAFAPIPPVRVFGAFVASGVAISFLLSVIFIPAYVVSLSDKALAKLPGNDESNNEPARGLLAKVLPRIGKWSIGHSYAIIAGLVVLTGVSAYGISRININDNPVRWFRESHELRIADRELNKHFAGTYPAYLVLEKTGTDPRKALNAAVDKALDSADAAAAQTVQGRWKALNASLNKAPFDQQVTQLIESVDGEMEEAEEAEEAAWEAVMAALEKAQTAYKYFQTPEALEYLSKLQQNLKSSPVIGKTTSIADIIKTINRDLHDGKSDAYAVPKNSYGVAEALLTYQSSHRPHDLWHFVSSDMRRVSVWFQLKSGDNQAMEAVTAHVSDFTRNNPPPAGVQVHWAGMTYLNVVWQNAMVDGMLKSLLGSFVIVLVMMIVLFRSVIFGLLSMIPLSITITFIYGLIGLVGKDYDMPVAVLSAMTLGLSVDFAIHFLQRIRGIRQETGNWSAALREMYLGPGRAITRNAIVIAIGFLPLLAAPLVPYNTVGFFMAAIMAVSGAVTLILLPAVVNVAQRYLPAQQKDDQTNDSQSVNQSPAQNQC